MSEESRPRVLLIEDNEQNRYLATYLLEHAGFDVISRSTGIEGLQAAQSEDVDLILLDVQLPDLDGYQIAARLSEQGVAVPVIAVSSFAMPGDRERALAAGCAAYLEKPIDPERFVSQVRLFLKS